MARARAVLSPIGRIQGWPVSTLLILLSTFEEVVTLTLRATISPSVEIRPGRAGPTRWAGPQSTRACRDDQMGPLDGPWADYLDDMTEDDGGHEEWWASSPSQ
jgi:hypothetical protein